ncbi:ABC transporter permease [Meiothermus hypogaeus]|uniref:Peptide ABC transporter permease n=2 Tax=Meiothermus hypogaeus TaxID=884155 RepID=A0A511R0P9_9DEIN|nr:ABC transporter permease [Meiothermus hypogaeus]RIH80334.1 Oligopeptide transport system permease protein OppC [Meiothermus hypogaeus]GEM82556.1 peptide ABC transporter permease [Meiothermus hypogaeus NBRC 106114]GIW36096.1 MAG: peptide ABC transporter permease [Meiothermus sp.]
MSEPMTSSSTPLRTLSRGQVVRLQFRKHRLAMVSLWVLGILYVLAAFADFIAPYGESESFFRGAIDRSFAPPTRIHWRDPETGALTRPFVYNVRSEINLDTLQFEFKEDTSTRYPLRFFTQGQPYVPFPFNLIPQTWRNTWGFNPTLTLRLFGVDKPATIFLWGADRLGRDVFGRILFGARITLTIGIFAAVLALVVGLVLGAIAGYYGGWLDDLIMRVVEVLSTIPALFLLLALRALFPLDAKSSVVFFVVILILGLIRWGGVARAVRGQVLSLREEDYVMAARGLGANDVRIIFRHVLPATASFAIVSFSLLIPGFILTESGLSFLGLGISDPNASWGLMLAVAQEGGMQTFTSRPWMLIPGLFIFITVLAFNFIGDGLRDALDPKARRG